MRPICRFRGRRRRWACQGGRPWTWGQHSRRRHQPPDSWSSSSTRALGWGPGYAA